MVSKNSCHGAPAATARGRPRAALPPPQPPPARPPLRPPRRARAPRARRPPAPAPPGAQSMLSRKRCVSAGGAQEQLRLTACHGHVGAHATTPVERLISLHVDVHGRNHPDNSTPLRCLAFLLPGMLPICLGATGGTWRKRSSCSAAARRACVSIDGSTSASISVSAAQQ